MSHRPASPQLQQYPGYYPAGSQPFWTRTKVAVATSATGLFLGVVLGAAGAVGASAPAPATAASTHVLDTAKDELRDTRAALQQSEEDREAAVEDAEALEEERDTARTLAARKVARTERTARVAQRQAVRTAVAAARREEQAKAAARVAEAERETAAASAPAPLASTGGETDPRFSYCYEANDAGYGPYVSGQDPEYDWYDDRDGDGVVCEY